jgi:DNA-binding NtrC family response regulator
MKNAAVRILVVDDEEIVRESLSGWLAMDGYTVEVAADGATAVQRLASPGWSILIVDLKMPGLDGLQVLEEAKKRDPRAAVVIMTAFATVDTAVNAMKLGAWDYIVKPFDPEELSLMIRKIVEQQSLLRENELLRKAVRKEFRFRDLESRSPAMRTVFDRARLAARGASTILILGESGTGKELMARAIHAESPRARAPFVAVSCAAIPETLLESELFGYEKGAFTGAAARRKGKFEAAHGGTLFLDEIGDIGPRLQADLLRVLEDRRFFRVGGIEPVSVDVRILAATNRDLRRAVDEGRFREDLYYRLEVIPIRIPPLRERPEDLPALVESLLEQLSLETGHRVEAVSAAALQRLLAHPWPGNVRELRNVLERAVMVASGHVLQEGDIDIGPLPGSSARPPAALCSLEELERGHVGYVLEQAGQNVTEAARILGIDRTTLYAKIKRYGLRAAPAPEAARAE